MAVILNDLESVTLLLNNRAITSFGTGDIMTLTPVNPHTSQINSSDGGVTINKRVDSDVYDLTIVLQKNSEDDAFLNSAMNTSNITVLSGSLKQDLTRDGSDAQVSWNLNNGSIITQPTYITNDTDGNATVEYIIRFRNAARAL